MLKPSFDVLLAETARSIREASGVMNTVRDSNGVRFMAGETALDGQACAHLIARGWLVSDGPRDYKLREPPVLRYEAGMGDAPTEWPIPAKTTKEIDNV